MRSKAADHYCSLNAGEKAEQPEEEFSEEELSELRRAIEPRAKVRKREKGLSDLRSSPLN